jgi:hypothetical protein
MPPAQAGTLLGVERNTLYYGDNLDVLRRNVKNESVDRKNPRLAGVALQSMRRLPNR